MYSVFVSGSNDVGQLGVTTDVDEYVRPTMIDLQDDVTSIGSGAMHNLAVTRTGGVISWGCNDDSSLGREAVDEEAYNPDYVQGLDDHKVVLAKGGDCHSVFLTRKGEVHVCGTYRNSEGRKTFSGDTKHQAIPQKVDFIRIPAVHIGCGSSHVLALLEDGSVVSWGVGDSGQLGRRVSQRKWGHYTGQAIQVHIPSKSPVIDISCGGLSSFAVTQSGEVFAWGLNSWCQLGISNNEDSQATVFSPTRVASLKGKHVISVSGGDHHTVFLVKSEEPDGNNRVYTAGRYHDGRLGLGKGVQAKVPTEVKSLAKCNITAVHCGPSFSFATSEDGRVYAWGCNDCDQLGTGNEDDLYEPTEVSVCSSLVKSKKRKREKGAGIEAKISNTKSNATHARGKFDSVVTISSGAQHSLFLRKEK